MKQVRYHSHPKRVHPSPFQIEELKHHQAYPLSEPECEKVNIIKIIPLKQKEKREKKKDLLLSKEVTDLDRATGISDGSVDRKMSVNKSHLVAISLCDTSYQVVDVAQCGSNGSRGLPRAEPGLYLERSLASRLILQKLEIKIEMLEVTDQLSPWTLHLYNLGMDLNVDPIRDLHCTRRNNRLHSRFFWFLRLCYASTSQNPTNYTQYSLYISNSGYSSNRSIMTKLHFRPIQHFLIIPPKILQFKSLHFNPNLKRVKMLCIHQKKLHFNSKID